MMKEAMVAQCDLCGTVEVAKEQSDYHNGVVYELPDNWMRSSINKSMCICPKCAIFVRQKQEAMGDKR